MPQDDKHEDSNATAHPTPGKAEGKRRNDEELTSKKGNVTVGRTPGKAEGTRENVEASLRRMEREQEEKRK